MAEGDQIEIKAILDTTDVASGVERINQALQGVTFDLERRTQEQLDAIKDLPQFAKAGASAGDNFMKGFLGKLLLRDAIYALISGLGDAVNTAMSDLAKASGDLTPHEGFWKQVGHSGSYLMRMAFPAINDSDIAQTRTDIVRENAGRQMERIVTAARDDPGQLRDTSFYEDQLTGFQGQRQKNQDAYDRERTVLALSGQDTSNALAGARANFDRGDRYFAEMEGHLRALVSMGRERDTKLSKDATLKDWSTRLRAIDDADRTRGIEREAAIKTANEKGRLDNEADRLLAEADRKDAQEAKRKAMLDLSNQEHDLGKSQGAKDRDLDYTEKSLQAVKATSAVMINGGLYGRNDQVGAMVQHAAQTVSLLRSIDRKIGDIRAQHTELSLTNP